jgi:hypothetical protein
VVNINMSNKHPVFMSVTEIEHNAKAKTLEISCKLYTDDFEKTLRANYKTKIDLIDEKVHAQMEKYVNDYLKKRLQINADGNQTKLKYIGFEKIDEAVYVYYEAQNIATVKKIDVKNSILYDYKATQISLIHATVNGKRQSTKLINPEVNASISF